MNETGYELNLNKGNANDRAMVARIVVLQLGLLLFISHLLILYKSNRCQKIDGTKLNQTGNIKHLEKKSRESRQKGKSKKIASKRIVAWELETQKRHKLKINEQETKIQAQTKTEETDKTQPHDTLRA